MRKSTTFTVYSKDHPKIKERNCFGGDGSITCSNCLICYKTKLKEILRYADMTSIKTKAMPRDTKTLNSAQASSLKSKYNTGKYTIKHLADSFGISVSAAYKLINGE